MRTLLFFDLPTITSEDRRNYRKFSKNLIKNGFYRIQESVFVKMSINQQNVDSTILEIEKIKPSKGNILTLTITEQQFARVKVILGDLKTDVVTSDSRVVEL